MTGDLYICILYGCQVCVCACVCVCVRVCVCVHTVCMYVYIRTCMHMCWYVYICIWCLVFRLRLNKAASLVQKAN